MLQGWVKRFPSTGKKALRKKRDFDELPGRETVA